MIGSFTFTFSLALFVLVCLCDSAAKRTRRGWVHRLGNLPRKSRGTHFVVYGGLLTVTWFSFYGFAVEQSGNVAFLQYYVEQTPLVWWLFVWTVSMTGLLEWNIFRFPLFVHEDDRLIRRNRYLEGIVVEAPSSTEGIESAIDIVRKHRKEWKPVTVESFLTYLGRRNDEVGSEARGKLDSISKQTKKKKQKSS